MSAGLVAGVDLGSTGIKLLVADEGGAELLIEQRPTPWEAGPGGTAHLDPEHLMKTVRELFAAVAERLPAATGDPHAVVSALALAGMGESGVLVDADGAISPAIAWFDPRGRPEIDAMPEELRAAFAGRTGLPLGVQVSVAKLLHLRDVWATLSGARWFNLPEYVAARLGGAEISEYSLASRTGLLDQDAGQPWPEMLAYLGVSSDFLPPLVEAGTGLGPATAGWLPRAFAGAELTVAGHDHLVAAVADGAIPSDRYHASFGTAEVLLRVLNAPLSFDARARLAACLINCVRHVVPGQHVLVAGVRTGLLLRRALRLLDITDQAGRERLDAQVLALPLDGRLADGALEVRGARNDDGVLSVAIHSDGVGPADVFHAILRHSNDELSLLIDAMDREVPPARATLLTGGWVGMRSVQRARKAVLPSATVSARTQDTAYGATRFAARLLAPQDQVPGPINPPGQPMPRNQGDTHE